MWSVILACIVVVGHADVTLELQFFKNKSAVCNDGSRSGYYFKPSSGGSKVWVVHQQGGGWCWNQATCESRLLDKTRPYYVSSKTWTANVTFATGSIFAATGTDFEDANMVYLAYCTSDGYIGNTKHGNVSYAGRVVVEALFEELHERGMGKRSQLIYSGCSAGGRGVMHNLNFVASQLKQWRTKVYGLVDSGLYIDVDVLDNLTQTSLSDQAKGVAKYMNAVIDPHCAKMFPGESYKCLLGQYAIGGGTLQSPYIINAFQYDKYQLSVDWAGTFWPGPWEILEHIDWLEFAENFRNRTRSVEFGMERLQTPFAIHSAACYQHCNTENNQFSDGYQVNGVSLKDVVQNFVFSDDQSEHGQTAADSPIIVIENCTGFNCGNGCGSPARRRRATRVEKDPYVPFEVTV